MAFVPTPGDRGDAAVAQLYDADREQLGHVANYTRLLALRPNVMAAWEGLNKAVKGNRPAPLRARDPGRRAGAAVELLRSRSRVDPGRPLPRSRDRPRAGGGPPGGRPRRGRRRRDGLRGEGRGRRDVGDAGGHRPAAGAGAFDQDVLDVALAAAMRCFWSKTLDALGVEPDPKFAALEPEFRDALVVGRPIATS